MEVSKKIHQKHLIDPKIATTEAINNSDII